MNFQLRHDGVLRSSQSAGVLGLHACCCFGSGVESGRPTALGAMKRSPMLGVSVSLPAIASLVMLPFSRRVTKISYETGVGTASMNPRFAWVIAACTSGLSITDILVLQSTNVMVSFHMFEKERELFINVSRKDWTQWRHMIRWRERMELVGKLAYRKDGTAKKVCRHIGQNSFNSQFRNFDMSPEASMLQRTLEAEKTSTIKSPVGSVEEIVLRAGDASHLEKCALLDLQLAKKVACLPPGTYRLFAAGIGHLEENALGVLGGGCGKVRRSAHQLHFDLDGVRL
jgi:hypothetical protein